MALTHESSPNFQLDLPFSEGASGYNFPNLCHFAVSETTVKAGQGIKLITTAQNTALFKFQLNSTLPPNGIIILFFPLSGERPPWYLLCILLLQQTNKLNSEFSLEDGLDKNQSHYCSLNPSLSWFIIIKHINKLMYQ